ncbi:FAD-binding domain-containing protein, partial [Cucurbitaria berberidis CBS 394.84]
MPPHEEVVAHISAAVKAFLNRKQSFRIFHGSTNSTRPAHDGRIVDISALSNILEVDRQSSTATMEPGVSMDKLVQATLGHGMIPPIVMEFPGITVGGGYAGSAGESSYFKYGYFDQTVRSIEMVLATGEVITASESENADLFKGAAGSLGSLGITIKLELRLIQAKRFVKLIYQPYSTIHDTITVLRQATENPDNDYVDGIMFSNTHGVLMTGQLTDDIPLSEVPQNFSGPWDPWFYLHTMGKPPGKKSTDYIPIAEYLFRYDRGGFWVGTQAFKYFGFIPFNRFTRWFLNDFMHTRMMYRALHGSNMSFGTMIHDLSLPYDTAEEFIEYTARKLGIWPLWLCPLRAVDPPTFHPCTTSFKQDGSPQPMLNIGLWGTASKDIESFKRQNRQLEAELRRLGGRKVLYSHTYYSEEEFWKLYDREWYEALRRRYSATTLPTVYDKLKVDVTRQTQAYHSPWIRRLASSWPFAGVVGIWCAIRSKDYLIHRQLGW